MRIISAEDIRKTATWPLVIEALRAGHLRPKAKTGDTLLEAGNRKMLVRSGWIEGLAAGVKAVTVYPDNQPPLPSVQGQVLLFDDETGAVSASLDGTEITKWKTAGDSALGADCLARPDVETMLMVGAGTMAEPLIRAHLTVRPSIGRVMIWNRTPERADELAGRLGDLPAGVEVVADLDAALPEADLVSCATMTVDPIISGALLRPGCHVDLVGAYTPEMREADDETLTRGRLFVDSYDTTVDEIGELIIAIAAGVITREDVLGDLHALVEGRAGRQTAGEITLFKNGGGAHLDIMTAEAIAGAV
ncbi:MAG TPA: ornithine cyclodeaminase [Afifellaceae bacterium]|nr:ornithine cyclodeaminase [Afifellaceae bacterium]